MVPGRSVEKHTSLGGGIGSDIESSIIPSDGRPRKLDAIREVQSWTYWGPRELYCVGVPLGTGAETVCHACPQAMGHIFVSGGGGGRCRIPWPGGVPFETRHLSTRGHIVSPTALPGSPSGVRRSQKLSGRGGTVSRFLPPCSSGGTSPALCGHGPPRNFGRFCGKKANMPLPLLGKPCTTTDCARACSVLPWLPS